MNNDITAALSATLRQRAPRPRSIAETGLSRDFLCDLLAKHLHWGGVLNQQQLIEHMGLTWPVLDELLQFMRAESLVEVRSAREGSSMLRYALTERGRNLALDALLRSGYAGPAPVPVPLYEAVVRAQSVHNERVTRADMTRVFKDTVIRPFILDQLGSAMHSGRPIFVYGPAGTGKTYVSLQLVHLLSGSVLIPHALAVGDYVVQFFDPSLHHPVAERMAPASLMLEDGFDQRFRLCRRPTAVTGGELTLDMLELAHDTTMKQHFAPLQLKANNGIYLIDDLGRQRVDSRELLNRWIVPLEHKLDYLTVGSGTRFPVPFDVVLIFSTNLNPLELADEAFLRRLGYKVRFEVLNATDYGTVWRQVLEKHGLSFDAEMLEHVLDLYRLEQRPLLPCQPRDLIGLALDQCRYEGVANDITIERLNRAWSSYFV